MKTSLFTLGIVATVLLPGLSASGANYIETWNSGNANWYYWTSNDTAMIWHATGGVTNSGYVQSRLSELQDWPLEDTAHLNWWPTYTAETLRSPSQDLLLSSDTLISLDLRAGTGMNLQGGTVHFFIGEWEQTWMAFFCCNTPLSIGAGDWQHNSFLVGGESNWSVIYEAGSSITATALFNNPQQYGLVILGASGQVLGLLDLDNFSVVPEPACGAFWLLGATLLVVARRGWPFRQTRG